MDSSNGLCLVAEDLCFVSRASPKSDELKFILNRVDLLAKPGEMMAIMGPSGSGKTSLLNIIAGRTRNPLVEVPASAFPPTAGNAVTPVPSTIAKSNQLKKAPVPFGRIFLNKTSVRYPVLQQTSRYVMQSDCLLPFLTVYETIRFAAQLKLTHKSAQERAVVVERVIRDLGLESCRNVPIGDQIKKGISGGQRKRVSIGIELLDDPQVLFLDEPTTGLDSSLAFDVLLVVKNLVTKSLKPNADGVICPRTVICTIHQPRKQIFDMFDRLALLSKGRVTYQGAASEVTDYWRFVGYPVPLHKSVADWSLDLLTAGVEPEPEHDSSRHSQSRQGSFRKLLSRTTSIAPVDPLGNSHSWAPVADGEMSVTKTPNRQTVGQDENTAAGEMLMQRVIITEAQVDELPDRFFTSQWGKSLPKDMDEVREQCGEMPPPPQRRSPYMTFLKNTGTLAHRFAINRWRNVPALVVMVCVVVLMSLFISFVFFRLSLPSNSSDCLAYFNVMGIVTFTATNQSFTHMQSWISFPLTRPMVNREKAAGLYNSAASLLGMIIGDFPFLLFPVIIHVLVVYWIVGLGGTAGDFFSYFAFAACICWAATGWIMFAAMLSPSASAAGAIAPIGIILSILLSGLWITENALPAFWNVVKYVTWMRYGVNAWLKIRFGNTGVLESCSGIPANPSPAANLIILVALGVFFRILAGIALAYTNTRQGLE